MTERSTVRSVTCDLLRTLNLSTVFGNPEASVIASDPSSGPSSLPIPAAT
ncbi:hypothetical protein ACWGMA_41095 [Streptomyces asiaticus]